MMGVEGYYDYDEMTRGIHVYGDLRSEVKLVGENASFNGPKGCSKHDRSNILDAIRMLNSNNHTRVGTHVFHESSRENERQDRKVSQLAYQKIKPMGTQASGEVKIEASWGDKEGVKISVGASGEVNDNKGNYVKAEIKQDNGGQGTVSVSAGAKKDK